MFRYDHAITTLLKMSYWTGNLCIKCIIYVAPALARAFLGLGHDNTGSTNKQDVNKQNTDRTDLQQSRWYSQNINEK